MIFFMLFLTKCIMIVYSSYIPKEDKVIDVSSFFTVYVQINIDMCT